MFIHDQDNLVQTANTHTHTHAKVTDCVHVAGHTLHGQELSVRDTSTLIPTVGMTADKMTDYIVNKAKVFFFPEKCNSVEVCKQSKVQNLNKFFLLRLRVSFLN